MTVRGGLTERGAWLSSLESARYLEGEHRVSWHFLEAKSPFALADLEQRLWSRWPEPRPFRRSLDLDRGTDWNELFAELQRLPLFEDLEELFIFRLNSSFESLAQDALYRLSHELFLSEKQACFMIMLPSHGKPASKTWTEPLPKASSVWLCAETSARSGANKSDNRKEAPNSELFLILNWIRSAQQKRDLQKAQQLAADLAHNKKVPQLLLIKVLHTQLLPRLSSATELKVLRCQSNILEQLLAWEISIKQKGVEKNSSQLQHLLQMLTLWLFRS